MVHRLKVHLLGEISVQLDRFFCAEHEHCNSNASNFLMDQCSVHRLVEVENYTRLVQSIDVVNIGPQLAEAMGFDTAGLT